MPKTENLGDAVLKPLQAFLVNTLLRKVAYSDRPIVGGMKRFDSNFTQNQAKLDFAGKA